MMLLQGECGDSKGSPLGTGKATCTKRQQSVRDIYKTQSLATEKWLVAQQVRHACDTHPTRIRQMPQTMETAMIQRAKTNEG
jgi:hypothetical protein